MTSIHVAPLKKMFQVQKTKLSRLSEVDFNNLPFGRIFADHMFVMDYHNGQWQQGTILTFGNLELSPATSALHDGQAIFEGIKANFEITKHYRSFLMKVVVIKYNAGNIQSVKFALNRLGVEPIVTDNITEINAADKVIFPGVGEASSAMNYLKEKQLDQVIKQLKQPVLGICLGMQLFCKHSEEGDTNCIGIFDTEIKKFNFGKDSELKVPQIGWNKIFNLKSDLFKGIKEKDYMYFVHGYYANLCNDTIAVTDYGINYSSGLNKNNFFGVQFHPEKSADDGQKLLENFIKL